MELSTKIRKIRELKGISQENVAVQLGISQAAYSRMEKDDKSLTFDKLKDIAYILEIDPLKILQFDEQMIFNNSNQAGVMLQILLFNLIPKKKKNFMSK